MSLNVRVRSTDPADLKVALLVLPMVADPTLDSGLQKLDGQLGGALGRSLERRDFRGGRDETLHLAGAESGPARVLLVGMGSPDDRATALRRAASLGARQAGRMGTAKVAVFAGDLDEREVEHVVTGLHAGSWSYDDLKTPPPDKDRRDKMAEATVVVADESAAQASCDIGNALGEGQALARRLAMMPGNVCTPDFLADTARDIAKRNGLSVEVWGSEEMRREKMGSFLSVAQGTPQEPRLITLTWSGGGDAKPIVLVGKGLCFDTGGISIKPAQGMEHMKFDMCGAAGVLGAMEAISRMKLPVNVVGVVGSTTNMPSGTAVKPGDVVHASNGKSIEVINTDAEGRLVLADLLVYAARFEPQAVLDAATLTGAIVIALGHTAVGLFGPDEKLVGEVADAARRSGEPGWPLPMWSDYRELIKSDVADVKNTGGRAAGSITAALFLQEFVADYPWVHLDIAGTAYSENDLVALPKGPTGIPVGTFVEFVRGRAS
ncbi:MAG TPA: leucyl aminopeptidase [Gemmatimonadales bacterium]|nr:leucyl aminopeptidase [Gemmatimonadales bacterium]